MTPCYQRHELLPGAHQDIPHEHDRTVAVKSMAEVLAGHHIIMPARSVSGLGLHVACTCGTWLPARDEQNAEGFHEVGAKHQADVLTAAGFGPANTAQAEAWDEGLDAGLNGGWVNPYRAATLEGVA